jgi:hypothetical protein
VVCCLVVGGDVQSVSKMLASARLIACCGDSLAYCYAEGPKQVFVQFYAHRYALDLCRAALHLVLCFTLMIEVTALV